MHGDRSNLTPREAALAVYAERLSRVPEEVGRADVKELQKLFSDREILDAVQSISYFAYANRLAAALGVPLGGREGAPGQ